MRAKNISPRDRCVSDPGPTGQTGQTGQAISDFGFWIEGKGHVTQLIFCFFKKCVKFSEKRLELSDKQQLTRFSLRWNMGGTGPEQTRNRTGTRTTTAGVKTYPECLDMNKDGHNAHHCFGVSMNAVLYADAGAILSETSGSEAAEISSESSISDSSTISFCSSSWIA